MRLKTTIWLAPKLGRHALVGLAVWILIAHAQPCWADNDNGISLEWAYLATYPEADCTKIHVYVKNTGELPVFLEGIYLDDNFITLNLEDREALDSKQAIVSQFESHDAKGEEPVKWGPRITGSLQWARALPNPVKAKSIADITVSLWGTVEKAAVRIAIRGGTELRCELEEEVRALRFSHIAFNPINPGRIYIYCENSCDKDATVEQILVNTEDAKIISSIPAGNTIKAGAKNCFIVSPKRNLAWGEYAGVELVSTSGARVAAVVRVINIFPIGSWRVDTDPELFFDSQDLRAPISDIALMRNTDSKSPALLKESASDGPPFQAYYDGRNPTCDKEGWSASVQYILGNMRALAAIAPTLPLYSHVCRADAISYAFFGELPDIVLLNPYMILFHPMSPAENARRFRLARTWTDPKPPVAVPEAFTVDARDLTADEVSYALWDEIGEGAKGLRYYKRHGANKNKGYSNLPGIPAQMARDNCTLQLLKCFLRIGDTYNRVGASDANIACKAILCGDAGIIVIALNRDFRLRDDASAQWTARNDVKISVELPEGLVATDVFDVDHGLKSILSEPPGQTIQWGIHEIRTVRVFLVQTSSSDAHATRSETNEGSPKDDLNDISDIASAENSGRAVRSFHLARKRLVGPLLESGSSQLSPNDAVRLGIRLRTVFEACWARLTSERQSLGAILAKEEMSIRLGGLMIAYAELGKSEMMPAILTDLSDSSFPGFKGALAKNVVELLEPLERRSEAIQLLEEVVQIEQDRDERAGFYDLLITICIQDLEDRARAIRWIQAALQDAHADQERQASLNCTLASTLIADGNPFKALEVLSRVNEEFATKLPIDFLRGSACDGAGRYQEAIQHYKKVAQRRLAYADAAQYRLSMDLVRCGRYEDAQKEMSILIEVFPASHYTGRAKELVSRLTTDSP